MVKKNSSKASFHGTFVPAHEISFSREGRKKMSIPQKKAMLHYCVERATHADLTKIMESIGKRQAKRKISDAKL